MIYQVNLAVDVYEDSYNEGEIRHANFWVEKYEVVADDKVLAISEAMEKIGYSFKAEYLDGDEGVLRYSVMVDEDNIEASSSEIAKWKLGYKVLYSANIEFKVYQLSEV